MGNSSTQRTLFYFCQHYSPDLLCLAKPMILFTSIPLSFWDRLDLSLIACNNRPIPSVWVLGKRCLLPPTFINIHDQHITIDVSFANVRQRVSFIYGSVWSNRRLQLWSNLYNMSINFDAS